MLQNSVSTLQKTYCVSNTNTTRLILFTELIVVYCENHTKQVECLGLKKHKHSPTEHRTKNFMAQEKHSIRKQNKKCKCKVASVSKHHVTKAYGRVKVMLHAFLPSSLAGGAVSSTPVHGTTGQETR
jgi:hypothetical protein